MKVGKRFPIISKGQVEFSCYLPTSGCSFMFASLELGEFVRQSFAPPASFKVVRGLYLSRGPSCFILLHSHILWAVKSSKGSCCQVWFPCRKRSSMVSLWNLLYLQRYAYRAFGGGGEARWHSTSIRSLETSHTQPHKTAPSSSGPHDLQLRSFVLSFSLTSRILGSSPSPLSLSHTTRSPTPSSFL